jgi:phosphate transport system permease protein
VTFNQVSSSNPNTIAANIALNFPESSGLDVNILITTGLVLFAITLVVSMLGRSIVSRREVAG